MMTVSNRKQAVKTDEYGRKEYLLDAYTKQTTLRESKTIPGLMVIEKETVICPQCGWENEKIEHGKSASCSECMLYMEVWGNSLVTDGWLKRRGE